MKTAVITGGNSGMGKAAAIELATKGYRVIIHGRDPEKTQKAVEEIISVSGNTNVDFINMDVTEVSAMKDLAYTIKQKTDTIHCLVLSTGVILPKQIITADGLEKGFAIQYLSRFAVTSLLMDELRRGNARIVQLGAPVIKNAKIHFDNLALKGNFTMLRAMAQEMFANHLFTQEFARRYPENEVVMNMLHVGIVKTGIARETNLFFRIMLSIIGKSPESAAKNMIYLATHEDVNFSGYFLPKPGKPHVREKIQYDPELASRLWDRSMELING
jgi:NAD(P)-dependent dehydrogenase (short-subunit alcohol dehydrogenase family)